MKSKLEPQIEDFQVGLGIIKDKIFSVSLSGAINFWKYSVDMKDGELPLDTFNGHQVIINDLLKIFKISNFSFIN